jgi:hypothetical protein
MELWKDIVDYEGLYQVSNLGRVRNSKGQIRKFRIDSKGYPQVRLSKNGKYQDVFIHKMVAVAFISNPDNKETVNHKDGDKMNWSIDNLEWATTLENTQHAIDNGLRKDILSSEDCEYIRQVYTPYHSEFGATALAKKFGVDKSQIAKIGKGLKRATS